ncbi:uncharacterized protein LOC120345081 [Styela clava]
MAPPKEENGDDAQSTTPEYRDRLRTWLIKMIDSGTIPGLYWENEEKTIFRMPWKHAGRQDYSLEEDSRIFMAWAIHSGRYREGIDKPEPIIWKTRLRCALNKMPDIREIPERSRLDISEPYRVYHFLPPVHKDTQIRRRLQRRHSQAQNSDSAIITAAQTSPTYGNCQTRKDLNSARHAEFQGSRLENRTSEKMHGINHVEFNHRPRVDVRNPTPWLRTPTLVPGTENPLLQGLNLNCLTSPLGTRNFVNPYNFLSVAHRDLRQRPEFDFPLLSYPHGTILDQQALHPFIMPSSSIAAGIPSASAKAIGVTSPFSRNLSLAAMAAGDFMKRNAKTGKAIIGGYSADSIRNMEEKRSIHQEISLGHHQRGQHSPERVMTKLRSDENEEEKCKIELLELELAKWKRAHDREKDLRESLQRQHEHLKRALENMGGDLLAMIMRNYSMNEENGSNDKERASMLNSRRDATSPATFRRRSAGDAQTSSTSSIGVQSRVARYSEDDKRFRSPLNGYESPVRDNKPSVINQFSELTNRKRHSNEKNDRTFLKPLDLSNSPPSKRCKEEDEIIVSSPSNKNSGSSQSRLTEYASQRQSTYPPFLNFKSVAKEENFRSSRNASKSSECDDAEVQLPGLATSSVAPTSVEKSPSTLSSCSSAEEINLGSSTSPNTSRVSPVMSLFRPERDNSYGSFKSSINGPIQVT